MDMHPLAFYILDVFAEQKYAGNQLAVFRQTAGLTHEEMQRIAREMHFSETTFILSDEPRQGGYDVRIFTPAEEVPFAGHPTLGTAHVVRNEILGGKASEVILNLQVAPITITFAPDGYCWMRQVEPTFGNQHPRQVLAAVLGLEPTDIDERHPVEEVSTGLPFFIVPLKTLAALKKARIDRDRYDRLISTTESKGILLFSPETHLAENDLSVRVFVEYYGVPEDPATGSGNGCLAAYLANHKYFGKPEIDLRAEQGYEIGRPSLLRLRADQTATHIEVSVGGRSVLVARGEFI
jgi:trans-2,3-dihydro-3-hydroxyanthranilate isomerase